MMKNINKDFCTRLLLSLSLTILLFITPTTSFASSNRYKYPKQINYDASSKARQKDLHLRAHHAISSNNIAGLNTILKLGDFNVNWTEKLGNPSLLHTAVFNRNLQAVKILLNEKDIYVNMPNTYGLPIMFSIKKGYHEIANEFINSPSQNPREYTAILFYTMTDMAINGPNNSKKIIAKKLIDAGADIHMPMTYKGVYVSSFEMSEAAGLEDAIKSWAKNRPKNAFSFDKSWSCLFN